MIQYYFKIKRPVICRTGSGLLPKGSRPHPKGVHQHPFGMMYQPLEFSLLWLQASVTGVKQTFTDYYRNEIFVFKYILL